MYTVSIFLFVFTGCVPQADVRTLQSSEYDVLYNTDQPLEVIALPTELDEVSGLAYDHQLGTIWAVDDDASDLFAVDPRSGEVIEQIPLSITGDWEGVTVDDSTVYLLASDGLILHIDKYHKRIRNETRLEIASSIELESIVLGRSGHLLIAEKSVEPITSSQQRKLLQITTQDSTRIYELTIDDLLVQATALSEQITEPMIARLLGFNPSGISQHPTTGFYYILSSQGACLGVFDPFGNLEVVHFLDPSLYPQAEGITFDAEARLLIANEKATPMKTGTLVVMEAFTSPE